MSTAHVSKWKECELLDHISFPAQETQENHHSWLAGGLGYPIPETTSQLDHKVNGRGAPFSPWDAELVSSKSSWHKR